MSINHRETLLTAIKASTLQSHLQRLAQLPQPCPKAKTPFEVYQYQESFDDAAIEQAMREEILMKLNQHLFEEEQSRLQMELFALQEAIEVEDNQIAMLRIQIEAERTNLKAAQIAQIAKMQEKLTTNHPILHSRAPQVEVQQNNEDLKDNSRLAIYPCVRVDLDPPRKHIPQLVIPHAEEKQHHKSHRQMIATYTKRSHTSSQEPPYLHKDNFHPEEVDKTTKQINFHPHKNEASPAGIQRQISFLERAWDKARSQGQIKQCKQYKKQLMMLIGQFWQTTK